MASFPQLRGVADTGKIKMWQISVIDRDGVGVIQTIHGYIDGKKQTNEKIISQGKNVGKKNETTPLQQAINEAQSAWTKKKESGYSDGLSQNNTDNSHTEELLNINLESPLPMLAHDFNKRGNSIIFPCFAQRKYDGTRCIGIPGKGLFSRNRKQFPNLNHIISELNRLPSDIILDGELYSDTLTFQEIVGIVKRETMKKGDDEKQLKIKFYVYDLVNNMPYQDRYANLQMLFHKYKFNYIQLVKTDVCDNIEHMKELHSQYVAENFEGLMLRNRNGLYKIGNRSADLQKYKEFFDTECEIVDYKEGEGLEKGCVIWICKTPENKIFSCRPRGSREFREELFINGEKYIGKMLTVRYQEKTDDGLLRFPVGISIRDYE